MKEMERINVLREKKEFESFLKKELDKRKKV